MRHLEACVVAAACAGLMAGASAAQGVPTAAPERLKAATSVRLKADPTVATSVRPKADPTDATSARLNADPTVATSLRPMADLTDATSVRLKADPTVAASVRPMAPPTYAAAAAAQPLPKLGPLDAQGTVTYFIADGTTGSQYKPADRDLAVWALHAWERSAGGSLRFVPTPEDEALVRVHWVPASEGQYGEMRSLFVNGRRGAAVYVRPDTDALGPDIARLARQDPLLRDTIVYLTCLHELGHALGLGHTAEYRDIMYFFGFGGDIPGFFDRYRTQLRTRDDIAGVSGLSDADVQALRTLYD